MLAPSVSLIDSNNGSKNTFYPHFNKVFLAGMQTFKTNKTVNLSNVKEESNSVVVAVS